MSNESILMSLILEQTSPEDYVSRFLVDEPLGYTRKFDSGSMFGDFSSTGSIDTDSFASVRDGDPVFRTYNNFTINAGHTVTTTNRCKGLYLNILGDLVVSGTLSMTARGANAEGQYVIIDRNYKKIYFADMLDSSFDYSQCTSIDKLGGVAAGFIDLSRPTPNNNNACGVGGSAGRQISGSNWVYTFGGNGTSFSGGSGAGGSVDSSSYGATYTLGTKGSANGGPGGNGGYAGGYAAAKGGGGGAGNPGGICQDPTRPGSTGTGGLMILFVQGNIILGETGSIQANGTDGGAGRSDGGYISYPGAGSGGGAIHIFHNGLINDPSKIVAIGGNYGGGVNTDHGLFRAAQPGGNGTVNIVQL